MKYVTCQLPDGTPIDINPAQVGYVRAGEKRGTTIVSVQGLALVIKGQFAIIRRKLQV